MLHEQPITLSWKKHMQAILRVREKHMQPISGGIIGTAKLNRPCFCFGDKCLTAVAPKVTKYAGHCIDENKDRCCDDARV